MGSVSLDGEFKARERSIEKQAAKAQASTEKGSEEQEAVAAE
jgi:hypothetical protein